MMSMLEEGKNKRFSGGQTLLEITILVVLLATAFTVMQSYLKRGIQGKVKDLTDVIVGKDQLPYVAESSESSTSTKMAGTNVMTTVAGGSQTKTINESGVVVSSSSSEDK